MKAPLDFSVLDTPELLQFVFYPRSDWSSPPAGASDHRIPVADGISLSGRFYPLGRSTPSILYFHGNGEVASDYDGVAPLYHEIGVNLFVADYRGYGLSGGKPTFSNMAADAHRVLAYFSELIRSGGQEGPLFVMGRSLGSQPAIELAANHPEELSGIIIESGFAHSGPLMGFFGILVPPERLSEFERAALERIERITLPAMIIHGEMDTIVPHEQARILYDHFGSKDKTLVTIPAADHNTILWVGRERYFSALAAFIRRNRQSERR